MSQLVRFYGLYVDLGVYDYNRNNDVAIRIYMDGCQKNDHGNNAIKNECVSIVFEIKSDSILLIFCFEWNNVTI